MLTQSTHSFSSPSLRATTAQSEMRIVWPLFFGCEMRLKAMPRMTLLSTMVTREWQATRPAVTWVCVCVCVCVTVCVCVVG